MKKPSPTSIIEIVSVLVLVAIVVAQFITEFSDGFFILFME